MIFIFVVISTVIAVLIAAKVTYNITFQKAVKQLFSESGNISKLSYHPDELLGLPEPVQRYFKHVLKPNQPYISYARITHKGQFKTGLNQDWVDIKGEQYATTETPGLIWKGSTSLFTAQDMFLHGHGRLMVTLFCLFNVVDGKGEQYDQGELVRWLGESVMYPTNLLPSQRLQWTEIDDNTARLDFNYKQISLYYFVTFNAVGEIIQLETKRYMDKTKLETWVIKLSKYKEMNAMLLPTSFEVLWKLEKEDFSYAKFDVKTVEFDVPEVF